MALGKYGLLVVFSLLFLGMAYAVPGIPHQFYGYVTVNGAPANNIPIVAKISGTEVSTTSSNGTYGYDPYIFYVPDPNGTNSGKTIDFYLSGTKVASKAFETGATTRLDLSIGTAPFCGDGTCNAGETCTTCAGDCGACPAGGAPLGGGGSGGGGGGGGTPSLVVKVEGSCIGQPVTVTVLNTAGNPAKDARVLVRLNNATVEEKITPADGKVSFDLQEAGDYTFYVTKNLYSQTTKTAAIKQCAAGEETGAQETGEQGEGVDLCENVDCDDSNPCTSEACSPATGHCNYNNQADETVCSAKGTCNAGVCEEPVEETGGAGAMGAGTGLFAGMSGGQLGGAGLAIIGLVALVFFFAGKRKKK